MVTNGTRPVSPARQALRDLFIEVAEHGDLWDSADDGKELLSRMAHALAVLADGTANWCGPDGAMGFMGALSDAAGEMRNMGMDEFEARLARLCPALVAECVIVESGDAVA